MVSEPERFPALGLRWNAVRSNGKAKGKVLTLLLIFRDVLQTVPCRATGTRPLQNRVDLVPVTREPRRHSVAQVDAGRRDRCWPRGREPFPGLKTPWSFWRGSPQNLWNGRIWRGLCHPHPDSRGLMFDMLQDPAHELIRLTRAVPLEYGNRRGYWLLRMTRTRTRSSPDVVGRHM